MPSAAYGGAERRVSHCSDWAHQVCPKQGWTRESAKLSLCTPSLCLPVIFKRPFKLPFGLLSLEELMFSNCECWRRFLRVPWTARRSNQLILKEINPEYSLRGLMLKLDLQYFAYLMWIADSLEKTPMLGKIEGKGEGSRGWDSSVASQTQWTWIWANWEIVKDTEAWCAAARGFARVGRNWNDWTTEFLCLCMSD